MRSTPETKRSHNHGWEIQHNSSGTKIAQNVLVVSPSEATSTASADVKWIKLCAACWDVVISGQRLCGQDVSRGGYTIGVFGRRGCWKDKRRFSDRGM